MPADTTWIVVELELITVDTHCISDIRSNLPADSISLGFVRTGGDSVTEINDADYKYGRREGVAGGNRKVFLGWRYFSGAGASYTWNNPFSTINVRLRCQYSGGRITPVPSVLDVALANTYQANVNYYGITPIIRAHNITLAVAAGGIILSNTIVSTGYFGLWAEVME